MIKNTPFNRYYPSPVWDYAADCATVDGFTIGSSAWMNRIRELLPIVSEDLK